LRYRFSFVCSVSPRHLNLRRPSRRDLIRLASHGLPADREQSLSCPTAILAGVSPDAFEYQTNRAATQTTTNPAPTVAAPAAADVSGTAATHTSATADKAALAPYANLFGFGGGAKLPRQFSE
jgi:hypothetical protein